MVQVNLFQKHLFLQELTHNMTKYCSFVYQFLHENYLLRSKHVVYINCFVFVLTFKTIYVHNMFWACSFHVRTGKSMNNILSYCGLVVARISASEKDLPVWWKTYVWSCQMRLSKTIQTSKVWSSVKEAFKS